MTNLSVIVLFLRKPLIQKFLCHFKMSCDMELKSSALEEKVNNIFRKVKSIKQLLQEVKLELINLKNSEEYVEIKEFSRFKKNTNVECLDSVGLPAAKRLKATADEGRSTDSPYFHYNSVSGWQSSSDEYTNKNFIREGDYVVVYTDGACENNGKLNAKAGIGVWFADNHPLNVSKPVLGKATNNTAEIQACTTALELLHREGVRKVRLKTDSQFTISCITQWINKWKKNNWKVASGADVKNKNDLVKLDNIRNQMVDVDWVCKIMYLLLRWKNYSLCLFIFIQCV
ncbi:hypothetical protein WA026_012915 [Henosepilachna vigintioctopunctata]|uniref:RNase H type-1 domain-containing protein n=1 Tax=Henosepilachna vigintioctopunctata TaxID=420089 RepID=A0AAW1TK51_9CUCU